MPHAVYPGTFDPFTPGHLDVAGRARRMFGRVTVLVAVNDDKRPGSPAAARAREIERLLPAGWDDVSVVAWHGLTADYCRRHGGEVIVRGVRNAADWRRERDLALMNDALGVATVLLPARAELAATSSTAARALRG
ncbi:pantetheine-phosphate adenylyltransferase [Catenuloplanes atrovinosus]|uniref:Pantetheine-phosphate adenylyltransferase n=1 Tax=Catenuloplanes atrovinosus TaxID=137266 RepID=A0AAE3YNZ0_9ACTN|nr:pantetheine-phosphate adenylyltransferase [Catenuloplanes atrovinosus]MDR7275733.1 pantetheine-phosphate adenylyltransferase [Catenuloplanes atrovinosus]